MTEARAWKLYLGEKDRSLGSQAEAFLLGRYASLVYITRKRTLKNRIVACYDMEDWDCVGRQGLLMALRSFDPAQASFTVWAVSCIKNTMLETMRNASAVSRCTVEHKARISAAEESVRQETGRSADEEQVAALTGLTTRQVKIAVGTPSHFPHLEDREILSSSGEDNFSFDGEDLTQVSLTCNTDVFNDPAITAEHSFTRSYLWQEVDGLNPRWAAIVREYYEEGKSMKVVSQEFGIGETRVFQILTQAKTKMRLRLAGQGFDGSEE